MQTTFISKFANSFVKDLWYAWESSSMTFKWTLLWTRLLKIVICRNVCWKFSISTFKKTLSSGLGTDNNRQTRQMQGHDQHIRLCLTVYTTPEFILQNPVACYWSTVDSQLPRTIKGTDTRTTLNCYRLRESETDCFSVEWVGFRHVI
jgi:hypothetical protein